MSGPLIKKMPQDKLGPCEICYSGHIKEREFGVGFVVGEGLSRQVLTFIPVDQRFTTISTKNKFSHTRLIYPDGREDVTKNAFYVSLKYTYERCP